ncbi:hypothetical protein FF38_00852 [Lucilia cuprina]|uniref:Caspase family p10 domain-containing protein n=1 Tax=Lucilia cuprina TaxID=7375 RepID=A0A0L0C4F7_LUCCU|nr:hypothetical protein FF38_00852 [Lucilia cuprina]
MNLGFESTESPLHCALAEIVKTDPRWLEKFDQCKFVAVVYLFHGSTDDHIICNNKILAIKCHFLHPLFCIEQLNGKLKWLIAQACRGSLEGDDIDTDGDIENKFLNYYMISYCTTEGTLSYQFDNRGKIFIQYICEELANNADNDCMTSLVTMMNNRFFRQAISVHSSPLINRILF